MVNIHVKVTETCVTVIVCVFCTSDEAKQSYEKADMATIGDSIKQYLVCMFVIC